MRTSKLAMLVSAGLLAISLTTTAGAQSPKMKMTTPIPEGITTPDKVETSIGTLRFFDGVPTDDTVQAVYDNLDRMRGVDVFLNCLPAASMYRLRVGNEQAGADLERNNKDCSQELPLPGTFLVSQDSKLLYRHVDVDFTQRAEPSDVLAQLEEGSG